MTKRSRIKKLLADRSFFAKRTARLREVEAYLAAYRSLMTEELDVGRFESAIEDLRSKAEPETTIAASPRSQLAFVYLHFAELIRGASEGVAELEVDRIFFLPLEAGEKAAFVSHRKLDSQEADPRSLAFNFFPLDEDRTWQQQGRNGGAESNEEHLPSVRAMLLTAIEVQSRYPRLLSTLDRQAKRNQGKLLVVEQFLTETPDCLILLTPSAGKGSEGFGDEDVKDVEALTRMFFQTYRSVRLSQFTNAYRSLVREKLVVPAQDSDLEATQDRISVGEDEEPSLFAKLFCFLCDSLSRQDVLPEMDNALFFPLNSRRYFLYQNVAAKQRPLISDKNTPAQGLMTVGEIETTNPNKRKVLEQFQERLQATRTMRAAETKTGGEKTPPEERFRMLFSEALRLFSESEGNVSARRLQRVKDEIGNMLAEFNQNPEEVSLITVVEAALFRDVSWADWPLPKLLDGKFLQYRGGQPMRSDQGSLLAITILADHLPLGVLFLSSSLTGAFRQEDREDVEAIIRAYVTTFQTRLLVDFSHEYQQLQEALTLKAFRAERQDYLHAAPDQEGPTDGWMSGLGVYFKRLFEGFSDLEVGAFFAIDRNKVFVYERNKKGCEPEELDKAVKRMAGMEAISSSDLAEQMRPYWDELTRQQGNGDEEISEEDTDTKQRLRFEWLYRWFLLRALEPEQEALESYPFLHEIPERLFGDSMNRTARGHPQLRSLLESVCFDAVVIDETFPLLRGLLRQGSQNYRLLDTPTGSIISMALFHDSLPAGVIFLVSSSFLAFTDRIERRDALLASRALFLPLQMEKREEVISSYQAILRDSAEQRKEFFDLVQGFLRAMAAGLPTMHAGLFIPLDRDRVIAYQVGEEQFVSWSCHSLPDFGHESSENLERIDRELSEQVDTNKDDRLVRLYLSRIRDILRGGREPKEYALASQIETLLTAQTSNARSLRSFIHVLCHEHCDFQKDLPLLEVLFPENKNWYARAWQGTGALLAVLVIEEGLPAGIVLLGSSIEGSFGEHERTDVDRTARVYFAESQVRLRDEIISSYREIVRDRLSETGAAKHIERLKQRSRVAPALMGEREMASYLAVFMDVIFDAFPTDPPRSILYFPLTGDTAYAGFTSEKAGRSQLERLEAIALSDVSFDTSVKQEIQGRWLRYVYRRLRCRLHDELETLGQAQALPDKIPSSTSEVLALLQKNTDTGLGSFLFPAQRYDQPLADNEPSNESGLPGLKPLIQVFGEVSAALGWKDETGRFAAGSLIITPILFDRLPSCGILLIDSSIPWRFTEQDRLDVESVARTFFLTYRSAILRKEAERAAKLEGMQHMLLGVTHRLKNDLGPTLGVIDMLEGIAHEEPETIAEEIAWLREEGQLEAGRLGVSQVAERFNLLRAVITGAVQIRQPRSLRSVTSTFASHVEEYKARLALQEAGFQTQDIQLKFNQIRSSAFSQLRLDPETLASNLDEFWIDAPETLDEILAIYAENAVKALGRGKPPSKVLDLWCVASSDRPQTVLLVFYDRVRIPSEKMEYIERGEVIPSEIGGGSGTGFFNARNLLELEGEARQWVESSQELGGTAVFLELPRLRTDLVQVDVKEVSQNLHRWKKYLEAATDNDSAISWEMQPLPPSSGFVTLYEGSYDWREELFSTSLQIFLQRYQSMPVFTEDASLSTYAVKVTFQTTREGFLIIELTDNAKSILELLEVYGVYSEKDLSNLIEEKHSQYSLVDQRRPVGAHFVTIQERLKALTPLRLDLLKNSQGTSSVQIKLPWSLE